MSFGLKNAGATYRRAIQACLATQIRKSAEAYVDDVVVQIQQPDNLSRTCLRPLPTSGVYRWKLKLEKCIFGVPSGKLLRFLISNCGIEANQEKIHAITQMKPPKCQKDV
jgi:hypothetical protein